MPESLTLTRAEDAVAETNSFLSTERGAPLDGDFAGRQIADRLFTTAEVAEDVLKSTPLRELDGFYLSTGSLNIGDRLYKGSSFDEAVTSLPGYFVLIPGGKGSGSAFFPAVVSEDGLQTNNLRLHILMQPYRNKVSYGAATVLSSAGQSETKGVGVCGSQSRIANDGLEAEHFWTVLTAGKDQDIFNAWQSKQHINHTWRKQPKNSVTTEASKRLFGAEIPQATITVTRDQIDSGQVALLWHKGMSNEVSGRPESATKDNALVVAQALGFQALKTSSPRGVENVKRLIS